MTIPTVPNSTILRYLCARGLDIDELRRRLSMGCVEVSKGNAVSVEIDGVPMIVADGCVFVAEKPTAKLKVEIKG